MKLGIMQPYFFPYLGYWQLIQAVDQYVVYDDVNFKKGWMNRNRILIGGEPAYFHAPLLKASQNKKINEVEVNHDGELVQKNLRKIQSAYGKAPYFREVYPLVEQILNGNGKYLSEYLADSIRLICRYLSIPTEILISSDLSKDNSLKGQDRIFDICAVLGADTYYNAIGGQELYSYQEFREKGIELGFIKTYPVPYRQFAEKFIPDLSILDIMMFNSVKEIQKMLCSYEILMEERKDV